MVGALVLGGAWAWTDSLGQATVGGVTAAATWYALHRLAERLDRTEPTDSDGGSER